ncbi:MAG: insulinase family protein [Nitrospira sp.]|nr:insulinase family protein [Nitrospira sp.]
MKTSKKREFDSIQPSAGVGLYALESRKFKTVSARVYFLEPISAQNATLSALLPYIMRAGSEDYPGRRELARAAEELYGAAVGVTATRFADVQAIVGHADFPADRFLPKGSRELEKVLALMFGLVARPALDANGAGFRPNVVELERAHLEQELKAMRDNRPGWASLRATQETYKGLPAAIHEHGRVEDLSAATPETLLRRHREVLNRARVMAFITGPVGTKTALRALQKAIKLPQGRRPRPSRASVPQLPGRARTCRENSEAEQTHLVFSYGGGAAYGGEGYAAMLLADAVFGGLSISRLFRVVREEHGLAYAVSSHYHRARGTLFAQAAVDPGKGDEAAKLIRREFRRLVRGGATDEEFASARTSLIESHHSSFDSPGAAVGDFVFQQVLGFSRSPRLQLRDIERVTQAELRAALASLQPVLEYRLGPK